MPRPSRLTTLVAPLAPAAGTLLAAAPKRRAPRPGFPAQYAAPYVETGGITTPGRPSGRITGYGGKCVDVAAAASANGTAVQLYDCNGTAAQNWTVAEGGSLQALGKCLDVTGAGTANGTKVQIWDCSGAANQQWHLPS